ncbi:hypothetical protein LUW76_36850 [Actinomadura madurae]|uniref:hypothetical protein n=1 Tax=Actinomadura madurae TaxID=1993 RepID=UPI002026175E|nr:hypothetical protein [Actinomadura madurae]URM99442.1 hypothetical protein LUW76_36850 [Actinomadura madurae]
MSADQRPHAVRFSLLADLCFKLGERQQCASMLVHPTRGEAVLWVPERAWPRRWLAVTAIDHRGRWLYIFGGQWSMAGDVAETAARVARAAGVR